ncbi:hypothetical protein [Cellulomonas sp. ES6]|uniref:hypothetical protein n=1 Tax=Cellulomonas sp. ES6 TaxID=3039384 RepID=UPI0024B7C579|nr:hypothetical protein [Cellulomonas sp. ES6]WHP18936.1 hypothetical protein P9841_07420 [Cellulomonas sp. ES6]
MDATEVGVWRSDLSERTLEANPRTYVLGVFRKGSIPRPGSVCIAFQDGEDGTLCAVGLGIAGKPQGVADRRVRTKFSSWHSLVEPIPLADLEEEVARRATSASFEFTVPPELDVSRYTKSGREQVMRALVALRPNLAYWLESLSDDVDLPPEHRLLRDEGRDAIALAADLAGIELPEDAFRHVSSTADTDSLLEVVVNSAYVADLEEDLLPEDLRRFDGRADLERISASASLFTDPVSGYQLAVFNVNKKAFETELGVDLVYWDKTNDTFSLIQYKRLERAATDRATHTYDWVYTRESELKKQLALMPTLANQSVMSRDWRLTPSPFWFKFVNGDAGRDDDNIVLKGMYVPAEYLRLAVEDGTFRTGERGGFRLGHSNTRYLTRAPFVELLRRGLIGTDSVHSKHLHAVIADLSRTGRQTLVAVKDKWVSESAAGVAPVLDSSAPF